MLFSITKSNIVLTHHTKEITKILAKGIFLIPKGYNKEGIAVKKITKPYRYLDRDIMDTGARRGIRSS